MKFALLLAGTASILLGQNGEALYKQMCATCHEGGADRAPSREALRAMSADRVLAALESGPMISVTSRRTSPERRAIAEFVSGKKLGAIETKPSAQAMCPATSTRALPSAPVWTGWGQGIANTHFQNQPGFAAADVPRLKVKWAFAFPGDLQSYAKVTINGDRLYLGSSSERCIRWMRRLAASTGISRRIPGCARP